MSGEWWSIMNIVGPTLLGIVLLWAVVSNRRSRREEDRTEEATHNLYDTINREEQTDHKG
jgi:hypothetical protein